MKRILTLDGLRLFAIIQIVIGHFDFIKISTPVGFNFFTKVLCNSYSGVCFFFLISGFGLTYNCTKKNKCENFENPVLFAVKKIKKIYPYYLLSLILCLPITFFSSVKLHGFAIGLMRTIVKIPLSLIMMQSLTGMSVFSHAFNGVCWFLSTLLILYIFFPYMNKLNIKMLNSNQKIKNIFLSVIIILLLNLIVFYILYSIQLTIPFFNDLSYGTPFYRVFSFILGILLCDIYICSRNFFKKRKNILNILEFLSIISVIVWYFVRMSIVKNNIFCMTICYFIDLILPAFVLFSFSFEGGYLSNFFIKASNYSNNTMYIYLFHSVAISYIVPLVDLINISNKYKVIIDLILVILLTIFLIYFCKKIKKRLIKS